MNKYMLRKEFYESLYDSKGLWMIVASSGILTGLCILIMNIKEGSVLAQNDLLQYAIKAALFLTLTVSMGLGASSMIAEREENTLESLLLTPISKKNIAFAKYIGVLLIGISLYVVSVPYLLAIGFGSGLGLPAVFITFFGGLLLLFAFVAIAMILSILMKSSKASVLASILIMIILTLPAMLQGILKLSAVGIFILKIDLVACCFTMMAKILTDRLPFWTLGGYIFPLVLFAIVPVILLYFASERIALKGEK